MSHSIKIVFGKEQVSKFLSNIPLSKEEKNINEKEYSFENKRELNAFVKGINETIGWMDCYIIENESAYI